MANAEKVAQLESDLKAAERERDELKAHNVELQYCLEHANNQIRDMHRRRDIAREAGGE